MARRFTIPALLLAPIVVATAAFVPVAHASSPADVAVASDAVDWIVTQQQPDGGFEVAGFPGFETPDAILAIAEHAQTTSTWSTSEARAAVEAVQTGGKHALDAMDDYVDSPALTAGIAAKLILLVAEPLGINPTDFDPQDDSPTAVDLVATMNAGLNPDGSYGPAGALNNTLYAALAQKLLTGNVPVATIAYIRSTQQADGAWSFAGDPTATIRDVDTTAIAMQALAAAGAGPTDPSQRKALTFLAQQQQSSGAWVSFGAEDPNTTSSAIMALASVGYDVTSSCWRDVSNPSALGASYHDPLGWLRAQQDPTTGRILSPVDSFGVNTFATSQSVQAFLTRWLPIAKVATTCVPPVPGGGPSLDGRPITIVGGAAVDVPNDAPVAAHVVAGTFTPSGMGGWTVGADGGVFAARDAGFYGSLGGRVLNAPIVGITSTPSGHGYWLVAADGGVFAFGDAGYLGGLGALKLNQPIVGMAATPSGQGYWLVARDGGVFAFGDAAFLGSLGNLALVKPIVGIASTIGDGGYWLLASDGGVFAFGNAGFHGSLAGTGVTAVVLTAIPSGGGYWIADSTRAVYARPF